MCDFDLSQALDSSLDLDETGCASTGLNMPEEVFRLDEGLDLVVSQDPTTLKFVSTLMLAVTRLKQPLTHCGRGLSNMALVSAIMDGLVTETIITATTSSLGRSYQRFNSDEAGFLFDISKKDVVFASGDLKLKAVTLKGGSQERKVSFIMARYICPSAPWLVVVLSVTDNKHISCWMQDGKAELRLEECAKEKLLLIRDQEDMGRFLFYKTTTGFNLNTFESVKYPGWVISTAQEDEDPSVEMCRVDAGSRLTCFNIEENR